MVGYGHVVPDGALPVFSVDTEEEAKALVVMTCPTDAAGTYYARELAQEQTLENLYAFGEKVGKAHDLMVKHGNCTCRNVKRKRRGGSDSIQPSAPR